MSKTDNRCICDLCTYMCNEGFARGEASDVTINVLGRSFPLHKIILMRSPYFRAMFSGKWKEKATQSEVNISIDIENITLEAVTLALKSLYVHRISDINESNQFAVLTTAEFFQLDGLVKQSFEYIINHLNAKNIVQACMFAEGRDELMTGCINWLSLHVHHISQIDHYWEIPIKIFSTLMDANQLWVKSEYQRYKLAHTYLNHKQFQTHEKEHDQLLISNFLVPVSPSKQDEKTSKRKTTDKQEQPSPQTTPKKLKNPKNDNELTLHSPKRECAFLETKDGQPYLEMFKSIHYCHMRPEELAGIKQDGVVPQEWINEVYQYYYHLFTNTLTMEHKSDKYSCRYGFEFKDVVPPDYETTEEFTSTDFTFAGSRWKLVIGFGQKDELDSTDDRDLWLYCELFRLVSDSEESEVTFKTYTNPNKKHSVSYQIIMLPSCQSATHVYALAEEVTLKEGFKDGGYWVCRASHLHNYLFNEQNSEDKSLRIIFWIKHLG